MAFANMPPLQPKINLLVIFDENIGFEGPRPLPIDFCAKIHGIGLEARVLNNYNAIREK